MKVGGRTEVRSMQNYERYMHIFGYKISTQETTQKT